MGMVNEYVLRRDNAGAYASLGQLRYLSCVQHVDAVIGNSSSGLVEVPSFRKATINIGERQSGRLKAVSVIDCAPERGEIRAAISRAYSPEFQATLEATVNPYGDGGASLTIADTLASIPLAGLVRKRFFDAHARNSPTGPGDAPAR
jgi:UDP-N-acetylglucosamine 2-epimerase